MKIRAKFMLQESHDMSYGSDYVGHRFVFRALYDDAIPEDQRFAKASPSAEMTIQVDNPNAYEYWKTMLGKQFYVDLAPA